MKRTNKEIAQLLGISITSVSLALNDRPGVSEETRQKVFALKNGYGNQNVILSGKSDGNTVDNGTLLLIIHKNSGRIINDKPFFSNLVEAVQMEAMKQSYHVVLAHYTPELAIRDYLNYIRNLNTKGIILMATEMELNDLTLYQTIDVPIVLLDASFDMEPIDSVELDNQNSILKAYSYLYSLGHRSIGYLKSETRIRNFDHRYDGFCKAMRIFNTESYSHPVVSLPPTVEDAYLSMKDYLDSLPEGSEMPTAFLSDLDYIAISAIRALKESGYKVPEDISVIGYDDIPECETCTPPLTTIQVNRSDIGVIAADRLIRKIRMHDNFFTTSQVASQLIKRSSVADIRSKRT